MVYPDKIKTYILSYDETEEIIEQYSRSAEVEYKGGVVFVKEGARVFDFAEIFAKMNPDFQISNRAFSMYFDVGFIYPPDNPNQNYDVAVIDM